LSDQVIIAIIGAIVSIIGAILVALVAVQNNKITRQGQEQERQKQTITRLAEEAKERQAIRLAEREADRLDKEAKQKEFVFWQDNYQVLSKQYNDEHTAYVALATKHEEFRHDFDATKINLLDVTKLSERQQVEITQLKDEAKKASASLSTANDTINSMNNALQTERANYDSALTRMNNDHIEKQEALQRQIDKLTLDLRKANDEIQSLHVQIQDFNSVNMQLARKLEDVTNERDALQAELAVTRAQLAALRTSSTPDPEPPDGSGAKMPVPTQDDVIVALPRVDSEKAA
jgi:chromosome segregation ATPase